MAEKISVAVCGALGKMGREVVKTVLADPALALVAAVDHMAAGEDVGTAIGLTEPAGIRIEADLATALKNSGARVCVDFTHPETVLKNTLSIIEAGCSPVVGTTGLSPAEIKRIEQALSAQKIDGPHKSEGSKSLGGMIVPNFAIGAVLMMKFAQEAAKYLEHAEIIELHHNKKADAPSGTAIKTAELMAQSRAAFGKDNAPETETYKGARGGTGPADIHIHSLRLPGLVAHQEVIFGGQGQTLTIRHDSLDRSSFMPGVALAVKKVVTLDGLVYGLENIL